MFVRTLEDLRYSDPHRRLLFSISMLVCLSLSIRAQAPQNPPTATNTPTPQQLRILPQPDAPLRIASADVTWATPSDRFAVQVYIVVENVSQQTVRTYATRRDINSTTGPKACLGTPVLPGRVLRPGQKAGTSTWQGVANSDPAPAAWIDFVELSDGTTWGADECHIAEWLDGGRTGTRMQRDQLLGILREKGADALMTFIQDNFQKEIDRKAWERGERPILPIAPPSGHSKDWDAGFSGGARGILQRVIDAYREWGAEEIEHVLLRPIDGSEKKQP